MGGPRKGAASPVMKSARYHGKNTDFSKLKTGKFPYFVWNKTDYSTSGCGACVLANITGEHPEKIKGVKVGDKKTFPDHYMLKFLRQRKFQAYEINKANLTNRLTPALTLTDQHVIMWSGVFSKTDSSWAILHNGFMFHCLDIQPISYLHLLNYPWLSGYVIYNENWKK